MATYKLRGNGAPINGLPITATFTDKELTGEQRQLLMAGLGSGAYEVIQDGEMEVAPPKPTPENPTPTTPVEVYEYVGAGDSIAGLPARTITDAELNGEQRPLLHQGLALGLYAVRGAKVLSEAEALAKAEAKAKADAEALAKAEAEAEAAEKAKLEAEAKAKAKAEAKANKDK